MTVTARNLNRAAGLAAVAAGLLFIGVQINHPHLDATSITTTEMAIRGSLKILMAVLALVGITGMYLRQVKQAGVLGLVGYVLISTGYLLIMNTAFVAAYVLPSIAGTSSGVRQRRPRRGHQPLCHRQHRAAEHCHPCPGHHLPGRRPPV